jgi:hypothetical protein
MAKYKNFAGARLRTSWLPQAPETPRNYRASDGRFKYRAYKDPFAPTPKKP